MTTIAERIRAEAGALAMRWRLGERQHYPTGFDLMKAGLLHPYEVADSRDWRSISQVDAPIFAKISAEDLDRFLDVFTDDETITVLKHGYSAFKPYQFERLAKHSHEKVRALAREHGGLKRSRSGARSAFLALRTADYNMDDLLSKNPELLDDPQVRVHLARTYARTVAPNSHHHTLGDHVSLQDLEDHGTLSDEWKFAKGAIADVIPELLSQPLTKVIEAINGSLLAEFPNGRWQTIGKAWPNSILGRMLTGDPAGADMQHGRRDLLEAQFKALQAKKTNTMQHIIRYVRDLPADLVANTEFSPQEVLGSVETIGVA